MAWREVSEVSDIPEGGGKTVVVEGRALALFKVEDKIFCTDNACLHQGGPLGEGYLEGNIITCPWHGWRYDVTTGQNVVMPNLKVETFQTKVEGNKVFVDV